MPNKLSAMQWCCLYDAEAGFLIAASTDPASVWAQQKDGAVCHPARVVERLERLGWLQRVGAARYERTLETTSALWLPVTGTGPVGVHAGT